MTARSHTRVALCVVLAWGVGQAARAQVGPEAGEEKEQPLNEVFQTDLVYPQEKGEVQLTLAPRLLKGNRQDVLQISVVVEYGLTDAWQLEVAWNVLTNRNPSPGEAVSGIGDLELSTRYSFMNLADGNLHLALGLEVGLPLGDIDRGLSEGFLEVEPGVILARDIPALRNLQVFTQVGVGLVQRVRASDDLNEEGEEPEAHAFAWNSGLFIPLGSVVLTTEVNWETNTWNNGGEENQLYVTPGLVWGLGGGWEVGLGLPIGLTDAADEVRLIGMLTFEFETR